VKTGRVSAVDELMARYRSAFVRADIEALLDCFRFPLQVVSIEAGQLSVSVASSEGWSQVLQRLLNAYERLRVADAVPLTLELNEPIKGLTVVQAHWALQREDGTRLYDFTAAYTLGQVSGELRIIALAHDELPKLRAASSTC
jgi:hypothetical protein